MQKKHEKKARNGKVLLVLQCMKTLSQDLPDRGVTDLIYSRNWIVGINRNERLARALILSGLPRDDAILLLHVCRQTAGTGIRRTPQ